MNRQMDTIKKVRLYLLDQVKDLSVEELNEIPPGFNNNIAWNLGHLVAAQQGVCYARAGVKPIVDEQFMATYKPGTKPERYIDDTEIQLIKDVLITSLDQFESDYEKNLFTNYTAFTTRYAVELPNIDDALQFLYYHEGLHSGHVIAVKRLVKK